ncbi:MAG: PilZ domain-containing protein [Treponemataceae bacterium]|nr:PilZ domain-containing protein [Treponemataceae bacterium]
MGLAIVTKQLLDNYYDLYQGTEIIFTKDILRSLRIDPRRVYVKCAGGQWPCIINSSSFQMAKIIIGTAGGAFQQIAKKDAPSVNLQYCFIEEDGSPLKFYVTCRVAGIAPYMNSQELAVITLSFTQRPPDDLIAKLGALIDANASFINRREERIAINDNTKRRIGLDKKESTVYIQGVPRRCILWNISFSGAKIVILGIPKFIEGKECVIRFMFSDPDEVVDVKGTVVKAELVEGREDLVSVGIKYDEASVPLAYKIRINEYLSNNRKALLDVSEKIQSAGKDDESIVAAGAAAEAAEH